MITRAATPSINVVYASARAVARNEMRYIDKQLVYAAVYTYVSYVRNYMILVYVYS